MPQQPTAHPKARRSTPAPAEPTPPQLPARDAWPQRLTCLEGPEAAARLYELACAEQEGQNLWLRGASLPDEALDNLRLTRCVLEDCRLTGASLHRAAFTDCVWERCELSGVRGWDSYFARGVWQGCRALGATLSGARLNSQQFTDCRLAALVLDNAALDRVRFTRCDLSGAQLTALRWKSLALAEATLSAANIAGTSLRGLDLRGCAFDALTVGDTLRELRGAIVDEAQAAALARLLGLDVR